MSIHSASFPAIARALALPALCLSLCAPAQAGTVCSSGDQQPGVDVSSFNGVINWNQVAGSGTTFAYARVSTGTTLDSRFDTNWTGIRNAGMYRGAMQYFRPSQDPVAQANLLLAHTGPLGAGDLPPVLDIEVSDGQPAATITAKMTLWINTIQAQTGLTPLIYTARPFWTTTMGNADFTAEPLWIAHWTALCPNIPAPWQDWRLWQYSATGAVPGITGSVDLDRFNGSAGALAAFANRTPYFKAIARTHTGGGYWLAGTDGGLRVSGDAGRFGTAASIPPAHPVTAIAPTSDGLGYWLTDTGGDIYPFGDAVNYGSTGSLVLPHPVAAMAATPSGAGYWLAASGGEIYPFGDAVNYGSPSGPLPQPITGMSATPDGLGYWLAGADGTVYRFGNAGNYGSVPGGTLTQPVSAIAATPTGLGYWLAGADGALYRFGDAGNFGSPFGTTLSQPVTGMVATPDGLGYWLAGADGSVYKFGDAGVCAWGYCSGDPACGMANTLATDGEACAATGVSLSWSAPPAWGDAGGPRHWIVYRAGVPVSSGPCAGPLAEAALGCTDSSAVAGTNYLYQARPVNGCGQPLTPPGATAADADGSLPLPMSTASAGKAQPDLTLTWISLVDAASYHIYRAGQPHPADWGAALMNIDAPATQWNDAGELSLPVSRFYTVTDRNSCNVESPK